MHPILCAPSRPRLRSAHSLAAALLVLVLAGAGALLGADAVVSSPDPSGTWKWVSTDRDGERYQSVLKLNLASGVLVGTLTRREGDDAKIENAKFRDGAVTFDVSRQRDGRTSYIKYRGRLDGDILKGSIESSFGGQTRNREWQAKRDKPAVLGSVAGTWQWTFTTPAGQTFEPRMVLTQDGETVAGTVSWGTNEQAISEGRFKDGQLFIKILSERDGRTVISKYDGKLEAGVIKGTIESDWTGDSQSSDWEAKRVTTR